MRELWKLYRVFFNIGICTFGGGYAMLALLQRTIVEQYHWATEEELMDYYAIGQCTPGIIALNTSTFIGYKRRGIPGGIVASLGFLSPSIVIILIIALFLKNYASLPLVKHAFTGIRACVTILILDAVLKLGKKSVVDKRSWAVFLTVALLSVFTKLSSIVLIVAAGAAGWLFWHKDVEQEAAER
ncbi:chromate transporter [Pseudoflavonifractor sp. MSJ-37]|uniref:chromate transporter n=1 Tax=Pseudoflavonifractor sp. MSJ-37 TaxID=2841531 RepID=UPI001C107D39|nr:chromate transporter [Pseudoflavonifractor sp. MSJ-37]MBU5436346.1 chromate transporter [Pseudoflavonifractor sp. MSJ-37]